MNFSKNIPNLITIARIIMSFLFSYAIVQQFIYGQEMTFSLTILFLGICCSDLLDGRIARRTNSVSVLGAKLDVFADLLYIILSYAALINVKILPLWFLGFIFLKFSEFIITSNFMRNNKSLDKPFVFDKVGRVVAAIFLIIPGIACIYKCFNSYNIGIIFNFFIFVIFIAGLYSSYSRIRYCFIIRKMNNKTV